MWKKRGAAILFSLLAAFTPHTFAQNAEKPSNVVISKAERVKSAKTNRINGIIYFENTSLVSAEIAGKAEEIFFDEGDTVSEGQRLLKTDTTLLEQELARQSLILSELEVKIRQTKKDFLRYKKLFNNQAASESSYDDLKFSHEALLKQKAALEIQMEITKIKIEKSTVYSPFTGLVIEKRIEKGNWVTPGDGVAEIGAADSVSVKVPVSESLVGFSQKRDTVHVHLTAFDKTLIGHVNGFKPYADVRTKNLYLKVRLDYQGFVAKNMSAAVDVPAGPVREVTVVPRDALVSYKGSHLVYTIKDGKALPVPVEVTGYSGAYAEVDSETLADGMVVIVDGNERLRPEQRVNIITEK